MSLSEKRYPLEPLMTVAGVPTMLALREKVPMGGSTYQRVQREGLQFDQADRWACRLGFVPWLVWPEWLDDLIEHESVPCADETCDQTFVPRDSRNRFCTPRCQKRTQDRNAKRRRYQRDATFAEKQRQRTRAYKAKTRRAKQVKDAAYRAAHREELAAKARARYWANRKRELASTGMAA